MKISNIRHALKHSVAKVFPAIEKNDVVVLRLTYLRRFHRWLNLSTPKGFNEKLNWLKLYYRNPKFTMLADKYAVKQFVADSIGNEYVVPCYGHWERFEDIDFDNLPDQFVLKTNHGSGGFVLCKDKLKLDKDAANTLLSSTLNQSYYGSGCEWPYLNIKPCILAEKLLLSNSEDTRGATVQDYKFWCFNGEPKVMYITVKYAKCYENFYDRDFNPVMINHCFERHVPEFEKPQNYEKMWELAAKLSKDSESPFVRVDFYNIGGKIYFGEYTFYDWAGLRPFANYKQDLEIGSWLKLPNHPFNV